MMDVESLIIFKQAVYNELVVINKLEPLDNNTYLERKNSINNIVTLFEKYIKGL